MEVFKFEPRLAAKFIANARRAEALGRPDGTHFEQVVSALLHSRMDWLPERCPNVLVALQGLVDHDESWFHTMMGVSRLGWNKSAPMVAERL